MEWITAAAAQAAPDVSPWVIAGTLIGTAIGSGVAAFFAARTARHTKTKGDETIGQAVDRLSARHHRRTEIFLMAHVYSWRLERLLKELVAADFEEAELENILRRKSLQESLGGNEV